MYKYLILCMFLIVSVVLSTTPTQQYNLYSVSTNADDNSKLLMVINPWDYSVLYNKTISKLRYDIIDILTLDTSTNTLLLFCQDASNQVLLTVDTASSDYVQLREIENSFNFNYALQSYIYVEDDKTATIPAQVNVNGTYYNMLSASDFATQSFNLLNLSITEQAPYMLGGFDYKNNIDYIAFMSENSSFHLLTFDYSDPESDPKVYYNIQNVMMINLIFIDPSGNVYFLNQEYHNVTGKVVPSGWYNICQFDMSPIGGNCESILQVYLGDELQYTYLPWVISQDKSTIALISNQAPGSINGTQDFQITFVTLDTNVKLVSTTTIPNDDPTNLIYTSRNFKF